MFHGVCTQSRELLRRHRHRASLNYTALTDLRSEVRASLRKLIFLRRGIFRRHRQLVLELNLLSHSRLLHIKRLISRVLDRTTLTVVQAGWVVLLVRLAVIRKLTGEDPAAVTAPDLISILHRVLYLRHHVPVRAADVHSLAALEKWPFLVQVDLRLRR